MSCLKLSDGAVIIMQPSFIYGQTLSNFIPAELQMLIERTYK